MHYHHIFGPVLSRRLGMSLGVDLVKHKICSLDCIYCECGKTTCLTTQKKEYVGKEDIFKELNHYWATNDDPDYITFSGSGEPCLNPAISDIIDYIKEKKPAIKVAVLTNATLFHDADVRRSLLNADRVIPSLDAATEKAFKRINHPHETVHLDQMIAGLQAFSREYTGQLFIEIFILPGINDDPENIEALKSAIKQIGPDRIQLNTLDRPGTNRQLKPADRQTLERIASALDFSPIEIIARVKTMNKKRVHRQDVASAIVETIHRRPCTRADLASTLGVGTQIIDQHLNQLEQEKKIIRQRQARGIFFRTVKKAGKE
jgi:wyosine [tRNA(Phe)-imidazoG37] synthetase (radical SAM superfamily)